MSATALRIVEGSSMDRVKLWLQRCPRSSASSARAR